MADSLPLPLAAHAAIRISDDGSPALVGYRCANCGAVTLDQPMACRRCATRAAPAQFHASGCGTLVTWSVVHRSFPGVAVPFVSAIVDLEDGLTVKATVRELQPDAVAAGMPLRLVFDDAGGALDAAGTGYVGFHFVPVEPSA